MFRAKRKNAIKDNCIFWMQEYDLRTHDDFVGYMDDQILDQWLESYLGPKVDFSFDHVRFKFSQDDPDEEDVMHFLFIRDFAIIDVYVAEADVPQYYLDGIFQY